MTIAIDFDRTIARTDNFVIAGEVPGAKEAICKLKEAGHYIIINTCRTEDTLLDAINWLLRQGIPFDRVNDNEPVNVEAYGSNSRKIYADVYVDDRQVGGLPAWSEIYEYITDLKK